mmetsp:Transcript_24855/g.67564  ORF Transcript_24855/g.67564 Transcript_24855/m.67564 type:complete len:107 (-) Transcript_24855:53-373(-)
MRRRKTSGRMRPCSSSATRAVAWHVRTRQAAWLEAMQLISILIDKEEYGEPNQHPEIPHQTGRAPPNLVMMNPRRCGLRLVAAVVCGLCSPATAQCALRTGGLIIN